MNLTSFASVVVILIWALADTCLSQTVRDELRKRDFRIYTVIFGVTVDEHSKLKSLRLDKVTDPKSGTTDAVDVRVPQAFVDAVRKKFEARPLKPKLKDGKSVEFFTYYFYAPEHPGAVITDLDKPLDKQP